MVNITFQDATTKHCSTKCSTVLFYSVHNKKKHCRSNLTLKSIKIIKANILIEVNCMCLSKRKIIFWNYNYVFIIFTSRNSYLKIKKSRYRRSARREVRTIRTLYRGRAGAQWHRTGTRSWVPLYTAGRWSLSSA